LNDKDAINIMLVILQTANHGTEDDDDDDDDTERLTMNSNIMYRALFNNPKLKEYWQALIQKGLISHDPNIQRFKTTTQGRIFLKAFKSLDYDIIKARTTSPHDDKNNNTAKKINPCCKEF
jgi:predicted transcriptional regulator